MLVPDLLIHHTGGTFPWVIRVEPGGDILLLARDLIRRRCPEVKVYGGLFATSGVLKATFSLLQWV